MITLYWSPNTRAVRMLWALDEEVGQPYELRRIDVHAEHRDDPADFLDASPLRKLPAMVDGDVKMAESGTMALYLADCYALVSGPINRLATAALP